MTVLGAPGSYCGNLAFFVAFFSEIIRLYMVQIYWDSLKKRFLVVVPYQHVSGVEVRVPEEQPGQLDEERFYYYADVHSHNIMPAFFSEQDNRDELATRLYIVVGRLQRPSPEIRARISNGGKFLEIPLEDVVEVSQAEFPEYWTASVAPWFTANRKGNAL